MITPFPLFFSVLFTLAVAQNTYPEYTSCNSCAGGPGYWCPTSSTCFRGGTSAYCSVTFIGSSSNCYGSAASPYYCNAGQYNRNGGTSSASCSLCPANTYSTYGASSCTACPSGTTSSQGSTSYSACAQENYAYTGAGPTGITSTPYSGGGSSSSDPCLSLNLESGSCSCSASLTVNGGSTPYYQGSCANVACSSCNRIYGISGTTVSCSCKSNSSNDGLSPGVIGGIAAGAVVVLISQYLSTLTKISPPFFFLFSSWFY
jgi:hypothetical protein